MHCKYGGIRWFGMNTQNQIGATSKDDFRESAIAPKPILVIQEHAKTRDSFGLTHYSGVLLLR